LSSEINPEMNAHLDWFIKGFQDAGLDVSVTIRPQWIDRGPEGLFHREDYPNDGNTWERWAEVILYHRVKYAFDRWKIRTFYVDSSCFFAGKNKHCFRALVYNDALAVDPGIRLILEDSDERTWGNPRLLRYSEAAVEIPSYVNLVTADHDPLALLRAGHTVAVNAWYADPFHDKLADAMQTLRLERIEEAAKELRAARAAMNRARTRLSEAEKALEEARR
jgi:PHD/YefM family antitoxin component YafN of YafNO toxin-antitoxin module